MIRNIIEKPLTKEKAIEWLDKADIGIPVVVILNNDLRCVSIYTGHNETGIYSFYDETGLYNLTSGYIHEKVILDMLREDQELITLTNLLKEIRRGAK